MATNTLVDTSRMQTVLASYCTGRQCMSDPFVALKAQEYRRTLGARIRALNKAEMSDMELPACDYFVSRKIDGECTMLLISGGECCSVNPGGVVRVGLPFMAEAAALLGKTKSKQILLAGELYVARTDRRPRVHDVCRAARQPQSQADLDSLQFAVFDIIEIDGKPAPKTYAEVFKTIESAFGKGKRIHPAETVRAKTAEDVSNAFAKWVDGEGAEGIVVRSDASGQFKIKPLITLDVAVLGYTESEERPGMVHDVLVGLMRHDNSFHILGRVGGGLKDDERRTWLSDLKDMQAESNYSEINDSVAYQMVKPRWVWEISCLDLVGQNTRGATVDRMVVGYDMPRNMYEPIRRLPLASPISPNFVRVREDKSIRREDLRLEQVGDLIDLPMMDRNASQLALRPSEIMAREVYTKTLKGNLMVRKLLLWKTNKEGDGCNHPGYVAYYTDFSSGRATPLERDIRISNSREQIEQLLVDMKAKYIVKGWAPHKP